MKKVVSMISLAAAMWTAAPACAQDVSGDRVTVNFSDSSRPGLLKVNLVNGGITVKSHSGNDVIVESRSSNDRNRRPSTTPDGLRRIDTNATGLIIEEENNVMTVTTRSSPGLAAWRFRCPLRRISI